MIATKDIASHGAHQTPESGRVSGTHSAALSAEDFRVRTQQLALREQIEKNHFLLERLIASSTRLLQSLDNGDVFEAIAEIIGNLVGSEEIAVLRYSSVTSTFSQAWSWGVEERAVDRVATCDGMLRRTVTEGAGQFRERQDAGSFLPEEAGLTACIPLKSGREICGVIAIFGLLPQKQRLEWADFELLKFLEVYAGLALQIHCLGVKRSGS